MPHNLSVRPAQIVTDSEGHPYSPEFEDIYASRQGAYSQACHVFLKGNGLPEQWQGKDKFVILENGFGLGTNFLATLKAWREDPNRTEKLYFVSIEKYPVSAEQLVQFADPAVKDLAVELASKWPATSPGIHEIKFDGGKVVLCLYFMDVALASKRLALGFDALYLDGFSPSHNSSMWHENTLAALTKLALPGATLATWCVARRVREALTRDGFEIEKKPGFGLKSQMTVGRFNPRYKVRRPREVEYDSMPQEKSVLVIGAGLAGAATASEFRKRGWNVTVIDQGGVGATGASAIRYGIAHVQPSSDDNFLFRLTRYGLQYLREAAEDYPDLFDLNGLPQLARDKKEEERWKTCYENDIPFKLPANLLQLRRAGDFPEIFGKDDERLMYFHPTAGLVAVSQFVRRRLYDCGANLIFNRRVVSLQRKDNRWVALGEYSEEIATASICVLCTGSQTNELLDRHFQTTNWTGRLSLLSENNLSNLKGAITGPGYAIRSKDNWVAVGASYEKAGEKRDALDIHVQNLRKLHHLLPKETDVTAEAFYEGVRCATADRLPLIGKVLAAEQPKQFERVYELKREDGLYINSALGSRGLVFSDLGARIIASYIHGEPFPVEKDLLISLDPARFFFRNRYDYFYPQS